MPSDARSHPDSPTPSPTPAPARLLGLTARIVAAHAGRNPVAPEQLPALIRDVHRALGGLGQGATAATEAARPEPAVPIRRSVRHDRVICLECGAAMTMLKRHLGTEHGLTPEAYRERWGLGRDYPVVAPDYAQVRSGLAKARGLGRKRDGAVPGAEVEAAPEALTAEPDITDAAPQPAVADGEAAAPATTGGRRRRAAAPVTRRSEPEALASAPAPARGRGRRRAKDAGPG